MLNNILKTIHYKDGFIHWCTQRFSAVLLLILLFSIVLNFDLPILLLLIIINVSFHAATGLHTLLDDYIHGKIEYSIGIAILRITILFVLKTAFVIFI